eukprot:4565549-Amphidinium_carterae.3
MGTPRLEASADAQANPRRYVITGWTDKTHRTSIVEQVQTILTRASATDDQIARELVDSKLSAPKVYGKVALIDISKPSQAFHSQLGPHFEEQGLRIRKDRPVQERLRSGQLVTVAKTADRMLAERSRDQSSESDTPALKTEICFSDGIVWLHMGGTGHELGRFDRPTQKWIWSRHLADLFSAEEIAKLQASLAQTRGFGQSASRGGRTIEYELPGSLLILGGFEVAKLCGIMIPCRHKASIVATHSWSYGLYIDMHVKQGKDIISLRLVCLHLPDSWKELHTFQAALQDLQHVLQTSPMEHLIVAGDWNVEMACCTESAYAESRLRARLTYEVLD